LGIEFEKLLETVDGAVNIESGVAATPGEFVFTIDRRKAELFGVNTTQLALFLRNAVFGSDAATIKRNNENIDVKVKYDLPNKSIDRIKSLTVPTRFGQTSIGEFMDTELTNSRFSVEHIDGRRAVKVSSYTEEGVPPTVIFAKVRERLDEIDVPSDVEVILGGENEDLAESFSSLGKAMLIGIFMIWSLLVLQFKSYRQAIFILITIPLALIGVLPGLSLIGQPLSFPGFIGIVGLAGIVVNNAIILIDQVNRNRKDGLEKQEAILNAGMSRFQPIILTTITTVAGILPLALSNSTWGPLAYSITFGLLFSTVLTLFVVPALYHRFGK